MRQVPPRHKSAAMMGEEKYLGEENYLRSKSAVILLSFDLHTGHRRTQCSWCSNLWECAFRNLDREAVTCA